MTNVFSATVVRIARYMYVIAVAILTGMMLVGVGDVILRYLQRPLTGVYELISLAGALVIGFSLPRTSIDKAHVYVDSFLELMPYGLRKIFFGFTRIISILLFVLLAGGLWEKAVELQSAREVSPTLHMPVYPFAYALGFCSLVEALVLFDILFLEFRSFGKEGAR